MAYRCGRKPQRPFRTGEPVALQSSGACWQADHIEQMPLEALKPDPKNPRTHDRKQVRDLAKGMEAFGFTNPLLIDEENRIIAGHGRLVAAIELGMTTVPVIRIQHLNEAQKRALAIADNAIADRSSWDDKLLAQALRQLEDVHFDLDLTGLTPGQIDFHIDGAAGATRPDPVDEFELLRTGHAAVSRLGDLWQLDSNRLLCGNALEPASYERLLGSERAVMAFSDPPYGVRIAGHVSGLGRHKHREFVMGSGEQSKPEFRLFLQQATTLMAAFSTNGAIHFLCMDWRHIDDLLAAGAEAFSELKNIAVWVKSNAGMGSLYRSQHELVAVFKSGSAPHINNVELGRHGRWRSNVWDYPGANAFGRTRDADLEDHPTCKPLALVADAIRDCSRRGDLILDPFGGSGTTILACERSGRRAAVMELDPLYVDVAVRRWQAMTGRTAVLEGDGRPFEATGRARTILALEDHSSCAEATR